MVHIVMELDEVVSNLYKKLIKEQESLGPEFSKVLYDNLWELYEQYNVVKDDIVKEEISKDIAQ
jgi:hypothetical protein